MIASAETRIPLNLPNKKIMLLDKRNAQLWSMISAMTAILPANRPWSSSWCSRGILFMCFKFVWFTCVGLMREILHDHERRYCPKKKKIFSTQGWSSHVRACNKSQETRQRRLRSKLARGRAFDQLQGSSQPRLSCESSVGSIHFCSYLNATRNSSLLCICQ